MTESVWAGFQKRLLSEAPVVEGGRPVTTAEQEGLSQGEMHWTPRFRASGRTRALTLGVRTPGWTPRHPTR